MRQQNDLAIDEAQRTRIAALANDFPVYGSIHKHQTVKESV